MPAKPFRFLFFFCPVLDAVVLDAEAAFDFVTPLTLRDAGVLTAVFDVVVVGWVFDEAGFGSAVSVVVGGAEEAVVDGDLFDSLRDKFSRGVPLLVSPSVGLVNVDAVPDSGRVVWAVEGWAAAAPLSLVISAVDAGCCVAGVATGGRMGGCTAADGS